MPPAHPALCQFIAHLLVFIRQAPALGHELAPNLAVWGEVGHSQLFLQAKQYSVLTKVVRCIYK